jgi:3,4-dihydroxy-2-butanone 4-phosphate synthase
MEGLASIKELLEELRQGRPVILVDDEDRENEGDLILAAEHATPDWVNFMLKECRGLLCVALTEERAKALDLPLMVERNQDPQGTRFTVSVDARGTTTGISAFERAATIRLLADPEARPQDFRRPGHVFPLVARPGESCAGRGTPRPRWTSCAWRASLRWAASLRSSRRTAAWPACPTSWSSPGGTASRWGPSPTSSATGF